MVNFDINLIKGYKFLLHIVIAEFLLTCTSLCLFSYGYPSTTRTLLWETGGSQYFNSDPRLRIYFYANHLEPPPVPYLWSQIFTDFNLGIAILAFWICVTKLLLLILKVRIWWTELFLQICLLLAWISCFVNQLSGDSSDEDYKSARPWYLTHSCVVAHPEDAKYACRVAQASFVFTILSSFFALAALGLIFVGHEGVTSTVVGRRQKLGQRRIGEGAAYDLLPLEEDKQLEI